MSTNIKVLKNYENSLLVDVFQALNILKSLLKQLYISDSFLASIQGVKIFFEKNHYENTPVFV